MKRQRKGIAVAGIAVLAIAAAAAAYGYMNRMPDRLIIGVGAPLTGTLSHEGQDLLDGVTLAVEEINAAGGVRIGNQRVPLGIESVDDKANAADGLRGAQQLVDRKVLVAVAHLNSGVSIPTAPIYAKASIPQFAISTKPDYTRLGLPTTLRLVANDDLQSKAIGSYAVQMPGVEKIAIVDDGTPYGKGLADQAAAVITKSTRAITLRRSLDDKTTEFADVVAAIGSTNADLVVSTLNDFQVKALMTQMTAAGLSRVRILGSDMLKTNAMLGVVRKGSTSGEVFASSPILEAGEFMAGKAFLQRFDKRFGHSPAYGAHYTYDAVFLVADALTRNGNADKGELLTRLKEFDGNAPITGTMRFDAAGEQRYGSIGIYRLTDARWELIFRSDRW